MKKKLSANRRMLAAATATLMGAGLLSATGLPTYASTLRSAATLPELVMESSPETTVTDNFNPFDPAAAPQGMGATGLIYEPLIEFDVAAPPKYYPWLATGYKWSNGGKSITFTIRTGVKWNDGVPMTPADVVYTFNLLKTNAAVNIAGVPVSSVSSSSSHRSTPTCKISPARPSCPSTSGARPAVPPPSPMPTRSVPVPTC